MVSEFGESNIVTAKELLSLEKPGIAGESQATPTEYSQKFFVDTIKNLRGGYFGLATHQNFTYISAAKSELAFIVDRSPIAFSVLQAHKIAHLHIASPDEYINFWSLGKNEQLEEIRKWQLPENEAKIMMNTVNLYGQDIGIVLYFDKKEAQKNPEKSTWLENQQSYDYVRGLFEKGKIHLANADVQNPRLFEIMENAANKNRLQFNVLYLSNVEDHLAGKIQFAPPGNVSRFWNNILLLPMGRKATILRTIRTYANLSPDSTFHYVTQPVSDFVEREYGSYEMLLEDVSSQITEGSKFHTKMPVGPNKRDCYIKKMGWKFP